MGLRFQFHARERRRTPMSLPTLMSSRSPSPYLPPGQLRGRSPRPKRVMVSMQSKIPDHSMLLRSQQMDGDGQALLAVEGSSANDVHLNGMCALKARQATKTHELFMLLLLLPFVFMCTSLHQALRGQPNAAPKHPPTSLSAFRLVL